jgi:ankyrin repeat protein
VGENSEEADIKSDDGSVGLPDEFYDEDTEEDNFLDEVEERLREARALSDAMHAEVQLMQAQLHTIRARTAALGKLEHPGEAGGEGTEGGGTEGGDLTGPAPTFEPHDLELYVCVCADGVGYRASPNMHDRVSGNAAIDQFGVATAVGTHTDSAGIKWIKLEGGGGRGAVPKIDMAVVEQLISMGFSENVCKRATLAANGAGVEAAIEWIEEHMDDADVNNPLAARRRPDAAAKPVVDAAAIQMVCAFGDFSEEQAEVGLLACDGDGERAAEWLFSLMDEGDLPGAIAAYRAQQGRGVDAGDRWLPTTNPSDAGTIGVTCSLCGCFSESWFSESWTCDICGAAAPYRSGNFALPLPPVAAKEGKGDQWLPTTDPSDGSTFLERVGQTEADAIGALLPPPPAVQYWLDGGNGNNPDGSPGHDKEAALATKWLVEGASQTHLSPVILKLACRALLAQFAFTANLEVFNVNSTDGKHRYPGTVWNKILMPQLDAKLAALGEEARTFNKHANVATELGSAAVARCSTRHPSYPPGTRARQDEAMPVVAPAHVYIHTLCLVALALDPLFATELDMITSDMPGTEVHAAVSKSFRRMVTSEEHRYVKPKLRPAMNIDIVRRLAVAQDTDVACTLIAAVSAWFGGFSHLKCLTDLATTDPAAAASRYHMLPVMLTVEFAPAGWTVGKMLVDMDVQAAWAARRATRPGGVSGEQWRRDHDAAVNVLRRVDPTMQLKQHCEVQLVLKELAEIRDRMHELYKLKQADSGALLYADVVKPEEEEEDGQDLVHAAQEGRITTVERLLAEVSGGSKQRRKYVNQRGGGAGNPSPLYLAAQNGHFPVVQELLRAKADPSTATKDEGRTPVYIAAENGHADVIALLVEAHADPSVAMTTDGATPVYIAAQKRHLDVLRVLLEANADPSASRTGDGTTPLCIATQQGDADVVALLLEINVDPSAARTTDGVTSVHIAAQNGRLNLVSMLLEARADPTAQTIHGHTAARIATQHGHTDIATLLAQHPITSNSSKSIDNTIGTDNASETSTDLIGRGGGGAAKTASSAGDTAVLNQILALIADPLPISHDNGKVHWQNGADEALPPPNQSSPATGIPGGVPQRTSPSTKTIEEWTTLEDEWTCSQCTLICDSGTKCGVCDAPRPVGGGAALVEAPKDLCDASTDNGTTLVWTAASKGNADVLASLLKAKADPSAARTTDSATPVWISAFQGHVDVIALLLDANPIRPLQIPTLVALQCTLLHSKGMRTCSHCCSRPTPIRPLQGPTMVSLQCGLLQSKGTRTCSHCCSRQRPIHPLQGPTMVPLQCGLLHTMGTRTCSHCCSRPTLIHPLQGPTMVRLQYAWL